MFSLVFTIVKCVCDVRCAGYLSLERHFSAFLFFRTPQEINIWGDDLFRPFSGSVWICLLLSIIIIAPTLKIALDWERYKALYWQRKMGTKMAVNVERESIMATILIAFGAYCQQGEMAYNLNHNRYVCLNLA